MAVGDRRILKVENKKTFGAYIVRRRKELGLTQRELAEKLYVTESAVSKWERGLSYPDITLVTSICSVLDISEHELLTGSEDTGKRNSERLASQYLRLTRNYRISQYVLYGLILLGCAIGNWCSRGTLDWFFIVVPSVLMAASLTLVPALAALHPKLSRCKGAVSLGCFVGFLELLLLVCCIYTGEDWFAVAGISVLFAATLILLPFFLPTLPLPGYLAGRKASVYLITETVLLILLLLISCIYTGGDWFVVASVSVIFGLGFFIFPVLIRQMPIPEPLKQNKMLMYFTVQTALLFLLLAVSNWYTGSGTFLTVSLPTAVLCLFLPWGIMLIIRYLPVSGWFRASGCTAWTGLWMWIFPYVMDRIMEFRYGPSLNRYSLWGSVDFSSWGGTQTPMNVIAIILISLAALTILFGVIGILRGKRTDR